MMIIEIREKTSAYSFGRGLLCSFVFGFCLKKGHGFQMDFRWDLTPGQDGARGGRPPEPGQLGSREGPRARNTAGRGERNATGPTGMGKSMGNP